MTKASDNAFPSILITEGTEPAAPAAGKQRLYIDSTTHKLKRTDSSGVDVTIESGTPTATGARVYNSANISISNNTLTALTFNSERYDTNTLHDTGSNTSRLTASSTGKWSIGGSIEWAANATGPRSIAIKLNGTTYIAFVSENANAAASAEHRQMVDCDYLLSATDYVELWCSQVSGGALNVLASGNYSPEFWMHLIGS